VNDILGKNNERNDLNSKIGILLKEKNLPPTIQQALDLLRVIGIMQFTLDISI